MCVDKWEYAFRRFLNAWTRTIFYDDVNFQDERKAFFVSPVAVLSCIGGAHPPNTDRSFRPSRTREFDFSVESLSREWKRVSSWWPRARRFVKQSRSRETYNTGDARKTGQVIFFLLFRDNRLSLKELFLTKKFYSCWTVPAWNRSLAKAETPFRRQSPADAGISGRDAVQ